MRDKVATSGSKIVTLRLFWDFMYAKWLTRAIARNDEGMKKLLFNISTISPQVKEFVL